MTKGVFWKAEQTVFLKRAEKMGCHNSAGCLSHASQWKTTSGSEVGSDRNIGRQPAQKAASRHKHLGWAGGGAGPCGQRQLVAGG